MTHEQKPIMSSLHAPQKVRSFTYSYNAPKRSSGCIGWPDHFSCVLNRSFRSMICITFAIMLLFPREG